MTHYSILIIGAGASGLVAAISALEAGLDVCVLEADDKAASKLYATGNGKCNFTHKDIQASDYHTDTPEILAGILKRYPTEVILSRFHDLGLTYREKNGYYYPYSEQAGALISLLVMRVHELGGTIRTGLPVETVERTAKGDFLVNCKGERFSCRRVILATGSRAGDFTSGDPYAPPYHLGLWMEKPLPALVKVQCSDPYCARLGGVRATAGVSLFLDEWKDRQPEATEYGEVQFTDQGLSGIVIFQLSGMVAEADAAGRASYITLDLCPELSCGDLEDHLADLQTHFANRKMYEILLGMLHAKLCDVVCDICGVSSKDTIGDLGADQLSLLAQTMKQMVFHVKRTAPLKSAQVARGGVLLSQLDGNLEVKDIPGCYLCGEVLNVDGPCGGYNLHWAWASGMTAGIAVAKSIR